MTHAPQVQDRRRRQLLARGPHASRGARYVHGDWAYARLEGQKPEYRIKHFSEDFERVALENELSSSESEHGQR